MTNTILALVAFFLLSYIIIVGSKYDDSGK